jgi:hypothetical protein
MNVYSHMLPDYFDKLAAAMDAAAKEQNDSFLKLSTNLTTKNSHAIS